MNIQQQTRFALRRAHQGYLFMNSKHDKSDAFLIALVCVCVCVCGVCVCVCVNLYANSPRNAIIRLFYLWSRDRRDSQDHRYRQLGYLLFHISGGKQNQITQNVFLQRLFCPKNGKLSRQVEGSSLFTPSSPCKLKKELHVQSQVISLSQKQVRKESVTVNSSPNIKNLVKVIRKLIL